MPARPLWWQAFNPWRHFAAALGWALFVLVVGGALLAAQWAAHEAEKNLQAAAQRRLQQSANQAADALLARLQVRLAALRATAAQWGTSPGAPAPQALQAGLLALQAQQPELGWMGLLGDNGQWLAATAPVSAEQDWAQPRWLARAQHNPLVLLHRSHQPEGQDMLVLAVPAGPELPGTVLLAQLPWLWLQAEIDAQLRAIGGGAQVQLLLSGPDGRLLAGPEGTRARAPGSDLSEGGQYLLGQAQAPGEGAAWGGGWQLWVREPSAQALSLARQTHRAVLVGVLGVGLLAALATVAVAHWLLRRLHRLAQQARAVQEGRRSSIDIPQGRDEVQAIGLTLAQLIAHWQAERSALQQLNAELDARVAARTERIAQLAQEARHAAVTRERLRLARGLHDTLAHSLMALLTQLRLLRKLGLDWPRAHWQAELQATEQLAADGLAEARAAIGQLRSSGVYDNGLGPELQALLQQFAERSAVQVQADIAPAALDLVDDRAATVLDMVRELLRNVERHAGASCVQLQLQPEPHEGSPEAPLWRLLLSDDGRGFDPAAPRVGHFGLLGLQEQAQQMGGQLHWDSAPGQGCRVALRFTCG